MEVVLGVSMTPTTVRMVLVEGPDGDGVTLDTTAVDPNADAAEQVVAAIKGTRESAAEEAHRLAAVGVAWTDHADGARLRDALRAHALDDVVMVSELHAASALAQAVGRRTGCARIALLFVERDDVTLAVVRTADGAVVAVRSRALPGGDPVDDLRAMVAALERTAEPPEAVFLMGAGHDVATLTSRIADGTTLPVHGPDDADLALARGAALAAAATPRFEAATVAVATDSDTTQAAPASADTAAGQTQRAAAGYMAPLGYSAVPDDDDEDEAVDDHVDDHAASQEPAEKPFLLVGSTLATIFVVGVAALVISLAVRISPAVEQRPDPGEMLPPSAPAAAQESAEAPAAAPIETIQAPRPVVQEAPAPQAPVPQAPRTVFIPAPAAAPEVAPAAPAPAPEAVPAPVSAPAAPAPVTVTAPAAPAPVLPPIVVAPVIPLLPPFLQSPIRVPAAPATQSPATAAPTTAAPTTAAPTAAAPTTAAPPSTAAQTAAPAPSSAAPPISDAPAPATSGRGSGRGDSGSGSRGSQSPIWPLWPPFGS